MPVLQHRQPGPFNADVFGDRLLGRRLSAFGKQLFAVKADTVLHVSSLPGKPEIQVADSDKSGKQGQPGAAAAVNPEAGRNKQRADNKALVHLERTSFGMEKTQLQFIHHADIDAPPPAKYRASSALQAGQRPSILAALPLKTIAGMDSSPKTKFNWTS